MNIFEGASKQGAGSKNTSQVGHPGLRKAIDQRIKNWHQPDTRNQTELRIDIRI